MMALMSLVHVRAAGGAGVQGVRAGGGYKLVGARDCILCDVDARSTEFSFAQPVSLDRLVPFDLAVMDAPLSVADRVHVEVKQGALDEWRAAEVVLEREL